MTPAKRGPATPASQGGQEAVTRDATGEPARPKETGQLDAEDRATTQSQRRPAALHPLPVWPD